MTTIMTASPELVFAIDRYNQGGYELFYDDFKGHAVFRVHPSLTFYLLVLCELSAFA